MQTFNCKFIKRFLALAKKKQYISETATKSRLHSESLMSSAVGNVLQQVTSVSLKLYRVRTGLEILLFETVFIYT